MADVLVGEVQERAGGRWRTVLTPGGTPVADRRRYDGFTWTRDDGDQVDAFAQAVAASAGINPDMISELLGYGKDGRYR